MNKYDLIGGVQIIPEYMVEMKITPLTKFERLQVWFSDFMYELLWVLAYLLSLSVWAIFTYCLVFNKG